MGDCAVVTFAQTRPKEKQSRYSLGLFWQIHGMEAIAFVNNNIDEDEKNKYVPPIASPRLICGKVHVHGNYLDCAPILNG